MDFSTKNNRNMGKIHSNFFATAFCAAFLLIMSLGAFGQDIVITDVTEVNQNEVLIGGTTTDIADYTTLVAYYGTENDQSTLMMGNTGVVNGGSFQINVTGLQSGTTYYFQVRDDAEGTLSNIYEFQTSGSGNTTYTVTTMQTAEVSSTDATLIGTVNPYSSATIDKVGFIYSTDPSMLEMMVQQITIENTMSGDFIEGYVVDDAVGEFRAQLNYLMPDADYYYQACVRSQENGEHWIVANSYQSLHTEGGTSTGGSADWVTIGSGTLTDQSLPTYAAYNYSITQQIYTASEIGQAGTIQKLAFFNNGAEETRTFDLYLLSTDKQVFSSTNDWEYVSSSTIAFSGSVTFLTGDWTEIELATPFEYDGASNLIVVFDDNTGIYAPGMDFLVFDAASQAINTYSDGTDFDPTDLSATTASNVAVVKNQIKLGFGGSSSTTHEYVDLGLPSGTLWATTNIGADQPSDYGNYYSWGSVTYPGSYESYDWTEYNLCDGTSATINKYCTIGDYGTVDNITTLATSDDAATVNWGENWRMPTSAEFQELITNCTWEWSVQDGKEGYLVSGNGNSIFLPAAGYMDVSGEHSIGTDGNYWSSSLREDAPTYAMSILFYSGTMEIFSQHERPEGLPIRPVYAPSNTANGHEYIDMGLPSGTKWATMNIGATQPSDFGNRYAWGETSPKDLNSYSWGNYIHCAGTNNDLTKYCFSSIWGHNGYTDELTTLEADDDAATVNWGEGWRMPTDEECQELYNNCSASWDTQNGVTGVILTSRINGNSIFIPIDPEANYGTHYWSSSFGTDDDDPTMGKTLYLNATDQIVSSGGDQRDYPNAIRPVYGPSSNSNTAGNPTPAGLEDYEFTTGTDGTAYSPSFTQLIQSGQDDQASELSEIGFTFTYDEVEYTQFSVNSNGRLRLGNDVISTEYNNPFTQDNYTQNTPAIVGVGVDLSTGADGYVSTGLYGSSGSYIRVVEFMLATSASASSDTYIKFQVQLFEATGEVRFVYSDYENSPNGYQIGIGNADATKFWYVDPTSHTAAFATESTETSYSTHPGINRYYSFAPPVRNNNSNSTDHEYVDLGLPSGTLWATMNIGAEEPEDFGSFFAWGETSPKSSYSLESYTYANGYSESDPQLTKYCNNASLGYNGDTDELTTLETRDDAATANWGSNWRMPTYDEVVELRDYCSHEFTTRNGVPGTLVTGPNNNSIFIPAAGGRVSVITVDEGEGSYWANSLSTSSPIDAQGFHFEDNSTYAFTAHSARRYYGYPIRPVYATSQTANNQIGSFTDTRDGRTYDYVVIGDQTWMAENLRYDNSGSMTVALSGETSTTDPYLYYPNGLSENLETYGYLYNWPAAMNGESSSSSNPSGVQGICPNGWHLPSDAEWTHLTDYLGGTENAGAILAGNVGAVDWYGMISESADFGTSGFNAIAAGGYIGSFLEFGSYAFFWTATENSSSEAYSRNINNVSTSLYTNSEDKNYAYSVRCIKDASNTANNDTNSGEIIYRCDFENSGVSNEWTLANGDQTNKWTIGYGVGDASSTETNCLYITNDGSSYNYNSGAESTVYAYKEIELPSTTNYHILFDWKCIGEEGWDYLRAFIIPTSENPNLSAGNVIGNGYQGANTTPDGWIDLQYGQMSISDNQWRNAESTIALSAGNYYLVFYWRNDGSGGDNPPAAVDNIFIYKLMPISVTANVSDRTSTSATLNGTITFAGEPENIAAGFKWGNSETSLLDNITTQSTGATFSEQLTGLTSQTTYYYQAYAVYDGDTAFSEITQFRTALDESSAGGANNPLPIGDMNDWQDFSNALQNPSTVTYKGVMLADYGQDIYFSLESDLSFTEAGVTFSIDNFKGNLNGNYNTITVQPYQTFTGLFANFSDGHIDNLNLRMNSSATLEGAGDFGVLCQNAYQAYISNCTVSGISSEELSSSDDVHHIGGLVGYAMQTTISGCTNNLKIVSGGAKVGGIVGKADGTIMYCTNNAELRGAYVGGIMAEGAATITNCLNTGLINCADECAGGISGTGGNISSCMNIGEISATSTQKAGGIIGNAESTTTVTNCANYGVFPTFSSPMGGIAGSGSGTYSHNVSAPLCRSTEQAIYSLNEIYATVATEESEYNSASETDDFFDEQVGDIKVDSLRLRFAERGTPKTTAEIVGSQLSGSLSSEYWDFTEDLYPKPKYFTETSQTIAARIPIYLGPHQSVFGVWENFSLPTSIDGRQITWVSSDNAISISDGTATVTRPASGEDDIDVQITADYDGYTKTFVVRVIAPKQIPVYTGDASQDSVYIYLSGEFDNDTEGITYAYDYGFQYSTTSADLSEDVTSVQSDNLNHVFYDGRSFSYPLAGIPNGTTVYYRAYATTVDGTEYGDILSHKALGAPEVVAKYPMWRTDNSATILFDITLNEEEDFNELENAFYYGTERNNLSLSSYIYYDEDNDNYSVDLHDLAANTKYYYVAEVTNDYGTTRSDTLEFLTYGTMTDSRDNTQYYTIQIGEQTWMAQNLKYEAGTLVTTAGTYSSTEAYRYNPDDYDGYVDEYGYLYNWPAVMNGENSSNENPSGVQGICPNGWHLPSYSEFDYFESILSNIYNTSSISPMLAGQPNGRDQYWEDSYLSQSSYFGASGFAALPTGENISGNFEDFGSHTYFWLSTEWEDDQSYAYGRIINSRRTEILRSNLEKYNGYSVRCIKGSMHYAYDTIKYCGDSYAYHDTIITTSGDYTIRRQIDGDTENIYRLHLTFYPALTATISDFSNGCAGANNGFVEVSATGGAGTYTYRWDTPNEQTAARLENIGAGEYVVNVTDAAGCSVTASKILTEPDQLTLSINGNDPSCYGSSTTLSSTVNGGTPDYSYAWSNAQTTSNITVTPNESTTYTLTVTDANGCSVESSKNVNVPSQLTVSISGDTQVQCFGDNTATLTASASGGSMAMGYTYNWSNSQNGQSISTLGAGNYIVTATDANGCTATASTTIAGPNAALSVSISATNTIINCSNPSVTLTATATGGTVGYTYTWSNSGSNNTTEVTAPGSYMVEVADANGCTAQATQTVTQDITAPTVTINNTETELNCNQTSITLTATSSDASYVWSNGETNATTSVTTPATYTVTATGSNGCTTEASVAITKVENPTVEVTASEILCNGSTTTFTANVSNGRAPYTYRWQDNSTNQTLTAQAGTYNVTITDSNGCTASASGTANQPSQLTASISKTDVLCNGASNGTATVTVDGGNAPYQYNWSNGGSDLEITGLTTGNYSVTVSDSNGCSTTLETTIDQPDALTATVSASTIACNGETTNATVAVNGGTTPYTYLWSDNADRNSNMATGITAGTYGVTVTDANGCTVASSVTIDDPALLTVSLSADDILCNGRTTTVTATPNGGASPYSYAWQGNSSTSSNLSGVGAGDYNVTVTDNNGCTATASTTVSQPDQLTASIDKTDVLCNGESNGTATVTVDGGTPPYQYNWSNGGSDTEITGLTIGTYSVTVSDSNGCSTTLETTIGQPNTLTAEITPIGSILCPGGTLSNISPSISGGTQPYAYLWNNGETTERLSSPGAGTYSLTVTDANDCTTSATITVDDPTPVSVSLSATDIMCNGGTTNITNTITGGSENYIRYTWSNGGTSQNLNGVTAGTYSVTVSDHYGCEGSASIEVSQPDALTVAISAGEILCFEGTTSISANAEGGTGSYSYAWADGLGSGQTFTGGANTYSVTVTDENGCTATASTTVSQPTQLTASITAQTNVSCKNGSNGSATVTANGGTTGYTYAWSNDANTQTISTLTAGNYSVTITDAKGCSTVVTTEITEPDVLTTSLTAGTISCNGETTDITNTVEGGTPDYSYYWTDDTHNQNHEGVSAGNYTVTVQDANGCSATSSIAISQPDALTTTLSAGTISCHGETVNVTNTVAGGTTPYQFAWSNSATSQSLTGVGGGAYSVTVTDANGCTASATITVTEPDQLTSSLSAGEIGCNGGIANITNTVNGGTEPITYEWSNGSNTQGLTGVGAGEYTVTVRDNNGCSVVQSATISQPDALTASLTAGTINCNGETTDITSAVNGGTQNYSYAWSNGETTNDLTGVGAGNYSVTVSDANSCTASAITTVSAPDVLTVSISGSTSVCENTTSTLTANVQGGTTDYTYLWSYNNSTTVSITTPQLTTATEYSVTVTDANNCSATAGVTVVIGDTPGISITEVQAICVGGNTILQANIYNAGDNYTVEWTSTDANAGLPADVTTDAITVTPTTAGAYTYTASLTATSCSDGQPFTSSEDVTLTVNALPDAAITNNTNETTITCSTTQISLTATGGNTYAWSNGVANADNNIATADTYIVTVTDVNGCSNTASETISEDVTAPIVSIANNTGTTLLTCTTTTINVETTGTGSSYLWSNEVTTATNAITTGGTYTVTATADNGCTSTAAIEITPNADAPTVSITNNSDTTVLTCSLTSINVTATGSGTSYEWSNGANTAENTLTAPGTYIVTATTAGNGCSASDQITITQNTDAPEIIATASENSICNGESTTISATGGESYTWSPETGLPSTVGASLTATPDTTITYTVTGTGTNGCTGTAELTVTVNQTTESEFTETACDSYDWNSTTYTESGNYVQTLQTVNGCDSVVTLHLTIYNSQTEFVEVTACDSYEWAGETYTVSGNYEHTFTAVNGCDSVVTLRLTINNSQTNTVDVTACESYEWNSNIYTETGDYEQTFQTTEGCDSVVTLHLTISSTITNEISDTACDSFQWNDTTYYASGEYIQTFYTREGCDSVVTLNLTINYSTEITDTVVVCDSFEWEGQTYTESGEYEKAYTTINGCDSIRRLHLTINQSLTESVEVTACESYQWNDSIYYASGDYEQTFQSVSGCDSVVTLHLTINYSTTSEISAQMCSGVPYTYEGETFTEAGTYTVTLTNSVGCDSIVTLTITYANNCGGIVSGIITDESNGEPIYNARVTIGNKVTRTNAEGEYSLEVLRGRKTFRVSASGYISHSRSVDIQSDTVFNISLNAPHIETDVDSLTVSSFPYLEQSDSITLSNTGSGTLVWSSITEYDNLALVEDSVIQQRRNTRSLWDSIQTFATRENAEQAIATDGFFIYTSSWMRPGEFNRYTPNGEYVETFYVENVGSIRNLSYDGTHFYGTEGTNIIFKLDLDNQTLVDSIETDIQEIRHCSFNKQDGSLLAGSWNSLYRIDIENGTSEPIRNDLANVYSSAFDNLSPGGPYLWLFSQTSQNNGPSAYIRQFNISTGEYTDRTHYLDDINLSSSSLAGGICASEYVCEGKFVLLADVQNPMGSNTIATYEIGRTNNVVRTGKKSGSIAPNSSENISVKASATETGDYSATIKYRAAVMGTYSRDIDVNISAVAPECDAVQQISIVTDTFHTVTLDWQPVELGNYESVSYLVFNTDSQYAIDTVSGTTVTYDGLPVGEHCFSVRALSQAGYTCLSAASDTVCAEIQDIPCNVPLAVEARSNGESITISWNMPVGVDHVSLYRYEEPLDEYITTTSYVDTNVVPETDYCYIVIAHFENGVCDEISGNACIRIASDVCTEAPVLTTDAVNGTVALEWTESNGAVNYRVFRNETFVGATNGNTYIDNVTESDEYCYRVESICEYGMFASSDEVCISVEVVEDDGSGSGEGSGEGEGDAIDEWTADNLTLYPNPTYGQFFIEGQRIAVIQIFNASGMLVNEIENTEDERITINCDGWNPGLYNIRIISTEGETATRKVTIFR